jgi:hypothetical protein
MKLKNLHCSKPLPGHGWSRYSRLEKGLVGAMMNSSGIVITCSSELCV